MATPQYGVMIAALGSPNGPRKSYRMYASDAAGGLTFPSGQTTAVLSGSHDVYIIDLYTPTALATMVTLTMYVGGIPTGDVLACATNIATTIGRQLQQAPVFVPRGKEVSIIQA